MSGLLQRTCACGGAKGPSGACTECRRKKKLGLQTRLRVNRPGDRYEREADRVAEDVMRSPAVPHRLSSLPIRALHRQESEESPSPIAEGLGTVAENLGENNPAFSAFTEDLANQFLSRPAPLSVGVPVFLGANYAFLWGMALVNPAMRRHFNDFNLAMLPGVVPAFPVKTFTYRILNPEQTRFQFEFGLDASGLLEAVNEHAIDTRISTLALDATGQLGTGPEASFDLSSFLVRLGLFGDGVMLSGGFRQGIPPYPLLEHDPQTGETSRVIEQVPALPDLFPEERDVRFMLQVDLFRLIHHFNPVAPLPAPPFDGDRVDRPVQRQASEPGLPAAPPIVDRVLSSPGRPLDPATRAFMEPHFGHDFSRVRVHTDDRAAASARAVQARAYTVGADVVFDAGQYAPGTEAGRRLLAHELTHVVQQGQAQTLLQRDTPEKAPKTDFDRTAYLTLVQEAVQQLEGQTTGEKTLSDVLLPLMKELAKEENVTWKDADGTETPGQEISYKPPGTGSKKIKLRLVLDEADPEKEKRQGLFSASEGKIVLFVHRNGSAEDIRETLFHEGLHLAVSVLETQEAKALGDPADVAVKALETNLGHTDNIEAVERQLQSLSDSVNKRRSDRGEDRITTEAVEGAARYLWEEITVRAETFYFELQKWFDTGTEKDKQPFPNYLGEKSLKQTYLKSSGLLTDADLSGLSSDEEAIIGRLANFLTYRQWYLIKGRGVINAYAPDPGAPLVIFSTDLPEFDIGPIIRLEDLEPDFLKKIEESTNDPVFQTP